MIENTQKKECKGTFNFLMKFMEESEIQNLTHLLNVFKREIPPERLSYKCRKQAKEAIPPLKEFSGLKVFRGGKN